MRKAFGVACGAALLLSADAFMSPASLGYAVPVSFASLALNSTAGAACDPGQGLGTMRVWFKPSPPMHMFSCYSPMLPWRHWQLATGICLCESILRVQRRSKRAMDCELLVPTSSRFLANVYVSAKPDDDIRHMQDLGC
jgi:hypothetical protein